VSGLEKRFTETHEWIDVASDGKTCEYHSPLIDPDQLS
jgi:hypothetical protein